MFRSIKSKLKSDYVKNVSLLLGGSSFSQLIIILIAPILTRLYTPEAFGSYELFLSIVAIVTALGTLQYDIAVYAAADEVEAIKAFVTALFVITGVCTFSFGIFFFVEKHISEMSGLTGENYLRIIIPFYVFFSCSYNLLITWFTKFGRFKLIASTRVLLSIIVAITQICFGLMNWGYWGLVISSFVVQFLTLVVLLFPFLKSNGNLFKHVKRGDIPDMLKKNYQLPLLVLPGDFINNLTQNIPAFFLGKASTSILGYYSLSRRVVGLPLNFIAASFKNIYMKEASEEFTQTGRTINTFTKNLKIFSVIGLILCIGIIFLSGYFIPIIFGAEWKPAVPIIIILSVSYVFRFVSGSLSFIMVLGKRSRKVDIFWQVGLLLLISGAFYLSKLFEVSDLMIIINFSLATCFFYLLYGFQTYKMAKGESFIIK